MANKEEAEASTLVSFLPALTHTLTLTHTHTQSLLPHFAREN